MDAGGQQQQQKMWNLKPFPHQVGGHASILCMENETVCCKPRIAREHHFYQEMPDCMKAYTPRYKGKQSLNKLFTLTQQIVPRPMQRTSRKSSHFRNDSTYDSSEVRVEVRVSVLSLTLEVTAGTGGHII